MLHDNEQVEDQNPEEAVETAETENTETTEQVETTETAEETAAEPVASAKPELEEAALLDATPHDEYDWSIGNRNTIDYNEQDKAKYLKDYEGSLAFVQNNEIVSGKITSIQGGDVVLDINYKSDGLVSLSEFRDMPELAVGDSVDVYVEAREDSRGQLVLSRRKAKLLAAWEQLVDSYKNGTIIKGTIVSKTKGGLIADCNGLETFLPGSQIDIKPIIDYDSYVGKNLLGTHSQMYPMDFPQAAYVLEKVFCYLSRSQELRYRWFLPPW